MKTFNQAMTQATGEAAKDFLEKSETASKFIKAKDAVTMLQDSGPHGQKTAQMLQGLLTKSVGIGDIGAVRLVSLDTETTKVYNTDTVFFNMLAPKRRNTVTDFTHGFIEENYGPAALDSLVFNPNNAPNEDNGPKTRRTNTLTAIGSQVSVGIVSGEMIKKRGFMDELDRQIIDARVKIEKSTNRQLLLATENAAGPVFLMGGLTTRTVTNVTDAGAADVTQAMLDTLIQDIVDATGVRRLRILAQPKQIITIHGWLKSDFPGTRIADFELANDPGTYMSTVYYSPLVGPVPVYVETALPTGTLMIYDPNLTVMNGFTIGDQAGPWVVSLAQTSLTYEPKVIFDMVTLEDRFEATRAMIKNLAT